MDKKLNYGKSIADRIYHLKEGDSSIQDASVSTEQEIDKTKSIKSNKEKPTTINKGPLSVIEKLNQSKKLWKRIGIDVDANIDDEIEHMVNNILKDQTNKKEIFDEVLQIGWPIWKKSLELSLKEEKNKQ